MKYQLCRMLLINAGTNMDAPSGRITGIDPRGGAAVLGENGVGKTTTLRILPLFFGHLPSQIVAAGHGQKAMIRFVLPTDASAIAFEYQRGSDDEMDRRLAVIRRRADDPDVPFYRLYQSGFRQDLFVSDGRFLSDDETQKVANELGILTTSKLTTSDYRSVILKVPSSTKDKEKLRRYSVDWSFGPKQLDNLDRVVAAMIKKHINFADIVQVAVGLVQHDLGQGGERTKISSRLGREPIDRWLNNRRACVDAFKKAGDVDALEVMLKEHRDAEAKYRSCRADVLVLKAKRQAQGATLNEELELLSTRRNLELNAEHDKKQHLEQSLSTCASEWSTAKLAAEIESASAADFEQQNAAKWELLLQELPSLKSKRQIIHSQLDAIQADQQAVISRYSELKSDASTKASQNKLGLEKSKAPFREQLAQEIEQITDSTNAALKSHDEIFSAKKAGLVEEKERLLEERGAWASRRNNPGASKEAMKALDEANQRLLAHTQEMAEAQKLADRMVRERDQAKALFDAQEVAVTRARNAVSAAQLAVDQAKARFEPLPGTLLAALRKEGHGSVPRNIACVIDPELLQRDDLDPAMADQDSDSMYGWRINTAAITLPEWADDKLAAAALESAKAKLQNAEDGLHLQQETLRSKGAKLSGAELSVQTTGARVSVLLEQNQACKDQVESANLKVNDERKSGKQHADLELAKIRATLDQIGRQLQETERDLLAEKNAAKNTHNTLKAEAEARCQQALSSIDQQIGTVDADLALTQKRLDETLHAQLSEKGIDVERLQSLQHEAKDLGEKIDKLEDHQLLVQRWAAWLAQGGPARVEALKAAAQRASDAVRTKTDDLNTHKQAMQASAEGYENAWKKCDDQIKKVLAEIETLEQLEPSFGDYAAMGTSVVDANTSASTLKSRAASIRIDIDKLSNAISSSSKKLRDALTAKSSTVKDLVEASLGGTDDESMLSIASRLCSCYHQIRPQVVTDINNTLKTLLANINAFQQAIKSFEHEVGQFNKRLQAGLTEVKCFERVKDLRLDIITNFEGLNFYSALSAMESVIRDQSSTASTAVELPSDDTVQALTRFMGVLGSDGNLEVNLSQHITLRGSVSDNGKIKEFKRASELESISSEGLTSLVLITLMTALLNTIRGAEPVHVPWVTDEVGKFDPNNFKALMQRLKDNRIDVVTASPELGPAQQSMFAHRYLFEDRGRIREYAPRSQYIQASFNAAHPEVTP